MTGEEKKKAIDAVERLNGLKQFIGYDKDSEIVKATQKSLDMAIEALDKVNKIKEIIAIDNMVIQEDVLKYKMICEVLEC